jgi:hypothetical protein
VRRKWYLAVVGDIPNREKIAIADILGADLGGVTSDSNGRPYTGAEITKQIRYALRRALLQRHGRSGRASAERARSAIAILRADAYPQAG